MWSLSLGFLQWLNKPALHCSKVAFMASLLGSSSELLNLFPPWNDLRGSWGHSSFLSVSGLHTPSQVQKWPLLEEESGRVTSVFFWWLIIQERVFITLFWSSLEIPWRWRRGRLVEPKLWETPHFFNQSIFTLSYLLALHLRVYWRKGPTF